MNPRLLVIASQPKLSSELAGVLADTPVSVVGWATNFAEAREMAIAQHPNVIAAVDPVGPLSAAEVLRRLRAEAPEAGSILLLPGRSNDPEQLRTAVRYQVTDLLFLPQEMDQLPQMVQRVAQQSERRGPRSKGRVAAIWSPRGGTGCTLLATNLAIAMHLWESRSTMLVDLDLPLGGVAPLLQLRPERGLTDLLAVVSEIDPSHLRSVLTTTPHGLDVLCAAPVVPSVHEAAAASIASALPTAADITLPAPELLQALVEHLVPVLAHSAEWTVLDLPTGFHPPVLTALGAADQVLMVVTPDASVLQSARQGYQMLLEQGYLTADRVQVVVNRSARVSDISVKEAGAVLGLPIAGHVPSGYLAVQQRLNLGAPLVGPQQATATKRRFPFFGGRAVTEEDMTRAIAALARNLVN